MKVYDLVGTTVSDSWASRGEIKSLGLHISPESAQLAIDKIMSKKDWRMDWRGFAIIPRNVKNLRGPDEF